MQQLQSLFEKNKVFILGLLGAIALVLEQFVGHDDISWKAVAFAVVVASVSYAARNLRGQWQTIAVSLGTLLSTFITMEQKGAISWEQIILQATILLIGVATGPVKTVGYEHSNLIKSAKENP